MSGEHEADRGDRDPRDGPRPQPEVATSPRVRDQPALTTSSGRSWLVLGGLLTLISLGVMIPMLALQPIGVALVGIVVVVVFYGAMVLSGRVADRKQRLALLAGFMIGIAVVAFITVGVVAAKQGNLF